MEFQSKNIALQRSTVTNNTIVSSGGGSSSSVQYKYLQLDPQNSNLVDNGAIALPTSLGGLYGSITGSTANYLISNNNGWIFRNSTTEKNIASISNDGELTAKTVSIYNGTTRADLSINSNAELMVGGANVLVDGYIDVTELKLNNGTQKIDLSVGNDGALLLNCDLYVLGNIYSEKEVSAFGVGAGGSNGGGLIQSVFGYTNLGGTFLDTDLTNTFNAYTINRLNNRLVTVENTNYLTGLTGSLVTNALGYTPYNASNPNGYITSSALSSKLDYRTFGTAANNNTGDFYATGSTVANSSLLEGHNSAYFQVAGSYAPASGSANYIQNQNSSAQSANMWISGIGNVGGFKISGNLQATNGYGLDIFYGQSAKTAYLQSYGRGTDELYHPIEFGASNYDFKIGAATFDSDVTVNGNLLTNNFKGLTGGDIIIDTNTSGGSSLIFKTVGSERFRLDGNGDGIFTGKIISTVATGTAPLTVNSTTMVGNLNAQYLGGESKYSFAGVNKSVTDILNFDVPNNYGFFAANTYTPLNPPGGTGVSGWVQGLIFPNADNSTYKQMILSASGNLYFAQQGAGNWAPYRTIYDSGNLTNALSTNYIPKWNGSSFANSLLSEITNGVEITRSNGDTYYRANSSSSFCLFGTDANAGFIASNGNLMWYAENGINNFHKDVKIVTTTPSTSPTNGALVVNGGIGAASSTFGDNIPPIKWGSTLETYGMLDWFSAGFAAMFGVSGRGLTLGANGQVHMLDIYNNGNTSIGYTVDQGYKLAVNGNGYFNGNVTASGEITAYSSSDIRLKENIQPLNNSLELINKLNPVTYNWNDKAKELNPNKTDKTDVGVIAQELEKVLPNLVHNIYNDEFLAVDYVKLIPYLIGAIQELTNKITKLENNK